jgi:hypothetical protein
MYSMARTTAKTPRDLEGSDALVERALEIKAWVKPNVWFFENPVGLLRGRSIMAPLGPYLHICSYCHYGKRFRKNTCLWTNVNDVALKECSMKTPCEAYRLNKKHAATAQCGPSKDGTKGSGSAEAAYPIPAPLVHQLFDAAIAEWEEEALLRWGRSVAGR